MIERLLELPAIAFRADLLRAGWPERTVDGVFRRCGRREPGSDAPTARSRPRRPGASSVTLRASRHTFRRRGNGSYHCPR